jgi:uncharacterized membrane protein
MMALNHMLRRALTAEIETREAAGLFAAVGSIGPSFQRGLLPRSTGQQAVVTGVVAAVNYALTTSVQAAVESFARRVTGTAGPVAARRGVAVAADATAVGVGLAVQRVFAQRPQERLRRAGLRALGWRLALGASAGAFTTLADQVADRLARRATEGRSNACAVLLVGAAAGSAIHRWQRRVLTAAGIETDHTGGAVPQSASVSARRAVVTGAGISVGLYAASRAESVAASGVAGAVGWLAPALAPAGKVVGHAVLLGVLGFGGYRGVQSAYARAEQAGVAVEPAYDTVPTSRLVSGGPGSLVDWAGIGREGRRYVNMALAAGDIAKVTGADDAIDPIRVFVGLSSARTALERADLAMRELERLRAFDRKVLAFFSPTGTGYVNYVAAEALEYLTHGNVASVAIQYSVRPSFLSLDRVKTAWEENLAFLTAVSWKLRSLPERDRPRLVLFGESLGSQAAQGVFLHQGATGLDLMMIDRALFIGSPYGSGWRRAWLADPAKVDPGGRIAEVASPEEWLALPEERRAQARIVLLTHHEDPIPKFGVPLLIQAPDWMGPSQTRAPGVPRESAWRPLVTFLITLVDLLNADHVIPGQFEALGHDYRKDLAQFVQIAFDLSATDEELAGIETALRERELQWARRRLLGEQLRKAEEAVRKQLGGWGVDTSGIRPVLAAPHQPEPDPFAAAPLDRA